MRQMTKSKNTLKILLAFLVLANILAWLAVYELAGTRSLEVVFFAIGQGDSIFIESPQGHQILIDGGPDSTVLRKLTRVMPFWDRTIDLVILTHPQKDHLFGLVEVLERYKVENILWTGVAADTFLYREWLKKLKQERANIHFAKAGQRIRAGNWQMVILYPFEDLENQKVKELNDSSIVARLVFGRNSFLFIGDLSQSKEKEIIEEFSPSSLDSDVLKVGHHGSKTSSSREFLETVTPEFAVISVGKNHFGHPHEEVLKRLKEVGAKVLRTDREGDIVIKTDGSHLRVTNDK